MKKILSAMIFTIIFAGFSYSQEETLIGTGEVTHGGFGAPVIKFTQIKGEPALLVGGRGGWIINHSFVIGGGGYGLANDIKPDLSGFNSYPEPYINFGYGGLELEYIIRSDQLLHFSVLALIGGGSVNYRGELFDEEHWRGSPNDGFFVFEPAANVEINIISFFRINAGVSYRLISGADMDNLTNKDFAGPSAVLTLKFGKF